MALTHATSTHPATGGGYTRRVIDEVRAQIKASDRVLHEARIRRDLIKETAEHFPGSERSFSSGSIAHGTVNRPVSDADAGIVVTWQQYPALGPDGAGVGPNQLVEDMREFIREAVAGDYPGARTFITKRAIKVFFNDPLEGQDPTADLVVALDRRSGRGLWIPNTERDGWDPSHPERHTELAHEANSQTGSLWAKIVRLAKANNRGYSEPALCSFNVEALALGCVERGDLGLNLLRFFQHAELQLRRGLTPDPAGVSADIKLLSEPDVAVRRMAKAAEAVARALKHDYDEEIVREALADVFPGQLALPERSPYLARLATELDGGGAGLRGGAAIGVLPTALGRTIKPTRSHGESRDGER